MSVTTEIADIVYGAKFGLNFIFRTRNFSNIGKNKNGKIDLYFFFNFNKNTVAGLVNQKIKKKWPDQ